MDGQGNFVRGDVLGLLAARYLGARAVVTPIPSEMKSSRHINITHALTDAAAQGWATAFNAVTGFK